MFFANIVWRICSSAAWNSFSSGKVRLAEAVTNCAVLEHANLLSVGHIGDVQRIITDAVVFARKAKHYRDIHEILLFRVL